MFIYQNIPCIILEQNITEINYSYLKSAKQFRERLLILFKTEKVKIVVYSQSNSKKIFIVDEEELERKFIW